MKLTISENIRALRRKMDMTQEELADKLCVSLQVVSRWETGATYPPLDVIPAMSQLFGVTADELIGVPKTEDGKAPKSVYDELQSINELEHNPENLEKLLEALRIAHRDYPNEWYFHEWLCLQTDDLNEKRRLAFELLEKCPDRLSRDNVIQEMVISEEDEDRLKELIDKYTSESDMSRSRLLCDRYLTRKEYLKYEPLKQLLLYIDLTQRILPIPIIRPNCPPEYNVNKSLWAAEISLQIINLLAGMQDKSLVAGDGEPDLWFKDRWYIGLRYCCYLSGSGRTDEALIALEELTGLAEKYIVLPEGTTLGFRCPAFSSLEGTVKKEYSEKTGQFISIKIESKTASELEAYYLMFGSRYSFFPLTAEKGWEWFDPIRNTDRFKACLARLEKLNRLAPQEEGE